MIQFIIVLVLILLFFLVVVGRGEFIPKEIKERDTQIDLWKKKFPNVAEEEIQTFLLLFIDAFLFSYKAIWLLSPEDTLKGLYDIAVGSKAIQDNLELEHLDISLDEAYGVKLEELYTDEVSLADIFSLTQKNMN